VFLGLQDVWGWPPLGGAVPIHSSPSSDHEWGRCRCWCRLCKPEDIQVYGYFLRKVCSDCGADESHWTYTALVKEGWVCRDCRPFLGGGGSGGRSKPIVMREISSLNEEEISQSVDEDCARINLECESSEQEDYDWR